MVATACRERKKESGQFERAGQKQEANFLAEREGEKGHCSPGRSTWNALGGGRGKRKRGEKVDVFEGIRHHDKKGREEKKKGGLVLPEEKRLTLFPETPT